MSGIGSNPAFTLGMFNKSSIASSCEKNQLHKVIPKKKEIISAQIMVIE
jgi:hypothetical protein